ncbi:LysM peptidoglycan-binding domain-containing protein [Nakamurella sp. YIM 132087]|uniref:LysM peptidoglycan-binding domain-containing protein n=2 Tax=Nakamurella alba TaxID=2665158 RepID=A0A7K1FFS8_9ACTN|nr:LysM peptidoglycan-binding domain-containing protein [Nakamurella alba]
MEPPQQPAPPVVQPPEPAEVVVLRGDTLWGIAAAHLPTGATDAEIDTAWRAWYVANRQVIGDEPDLLLPGQRLTAPAPGDTAPPGGQP